MENKRLRPKMVEELNKRLIEENTCFRYKEISNEIGMTCYSLTVVDKYINSEYDYSVSYTKEFENMVKGFFKDKYCVEETGFSNSIQQLRAWNEEE